MSKPKESKRKFYKTVFQVTVLSEEPIGPDVELGDLAYGITDGDWSGAVELKSGEVLSGRQMVRALEDQASSPSFFGLNEDGSEGQR